MGTVGLHVLCGCVCMCVCVSTCERESVLVGIQVCGVLQPSVGLLSLVKHRGTTGHRLGTAVHLLPSSFTFSRHGLLFAHPVICQHSSAVAPCFSANLSSCTRSLISRSRRICPCDSDTGCIYNRVYSESGPFLPLRLPMEV